MVSTRLRLGYRPIWQVCRPGDVPQYSSCKLCDSSIANNLEHYCFQVPALADFIPLRHSTVDVCKYLLTDDHLDVILMGHPRFGGY